MTRHIKGFIRYLRNTEAISALEYAILLGVISVALVAALTTFSDNIKDAVVKISTNIETKQGDTGSTNPTN